MNAALWGVITASGWGMADFAARFTGRALGHQNALLGMLLSGSVVLTVYYVVVGPPFVADPAGLWLVFLNGVSIMLATLLLYEALARGPVTVVSPIVGSYPALVVLFAVAMGSRPAAEDWAAMAVVMCGVFTVSRYAPTTNEPAHADPKYNRRTVVISLLSAVIFAMVVITGQEAARVYGELQATWLGRLVSLASLMALFALRRDYSVSLPVRWWPLLGAQGVLDSIAYVSLFAASHEPNAEVAAVTASAFGAVTVVLARVFLREQMSRAQWAGIVAVFAGVGFLSA